MDYDYERERAEDEKNIRVALKLHRYGFPTFCDEMRDKGLHVELHADNETFTVEVVEGAESLATARMSRYSSRALDRAARQVRAVLEVEDLIEPWSA